MAVDWSKPIRCMYDGEWRPARYLGQMKVRRGCDDRLVAIDHGDWESVIWTSDSGNAHQSRIVTNVPQKHAAWVNVYPGFAGGVWTTREEADKSACTRRIACVRVEFQEGEGLE